MSLGRLPEADEVPSQCLTNLAELRVGWPRLLDLLREDVSLDKAFAEAGRGRREDLLVHMALQQFPGIR